MKGRTKKQHLDQGFFLGRIGGNIDATFRAKLIFRLIEAAFWTTYQHVLSVAHHVARLKVSFKSKELLAV